MTEEEIDKLKFEIRTLKSTIYELNQKNQDLKKVCEFLSNNNMKLITELNVVGISRERVMHTLTGTEAWAERTMTSLERTVANTPVELNPEYKDFFSDDVDVSQP